MRLREDAPRIRHGNSPPNRASVRQIVRNLLKRDSAQGSRRCQRFQVAPDADFLAHLITLL